MNLNALLMTPAQGGQGGGMGQLVFLGLMVVVFYFFIIRPQSQKAKKEREFKTTLKKGNRIVTLGGIHAKIVEELDDTFLIEVESGAKMKLEKSAISVEATKLLNKE